jgi:hypothetical protein
MKQLIIKRAQEAEEKRLKAIEEEEARRLK